MEEPEYYLIESKDIHYLQELMKRLYSEKRMYGDEMRDNGNRLSLVIKDALPYEDPNSP